MANTLAFVPLTATPVVAAVISFDAGELVGRPTDSSITINAVPSQDADIYYEYGTSSGSYTQVSSTVRGSASTPLDITINGLSANTHYFYRMRYRTLEGGAQWESRGEHSFRTQRSAGSTFTFVMQSDAHIPANNTIYNQTIANMAADNPDFLIDLGDMFAISGSAENVRDKYLAQRQHLEPISSDASVFLVLGNWENEEGWFRSGSTPQLPIYGANARKAYFLNPVPSSFYSGDTEDYSSLGVDGDGLRETYYSFEWGSALFVVLDPFWNTTSRPHGVTIGGDPVETPVTGNRWNWTLGQDQYNWLEQTLSSSSATHKFVFSHHVTGGTNTLARGGTRAIDAGYEWGAQGSTFTSNRPGWTHGSIHQIMVDNDVDIFFHGHDHCYDVESRDGIVYQEIPTPADNPGNFCGSNYEGIEIESPGHVRVTVAPSETRVDYVRSFPGNQGGTNRSIAHSYTVAGVSQPDNTPPVITLNGGDPQTIEAGDGYTELGAMAFDVVDGVVPVSIDAGDVDTNQLGTYQVRYDASDSSGNDADTVTRTVNVTDTTRPTITVLGSSPTFVDVGDPYIDDGATAVDSFEGSLSVVTDLSDVDTSQLGSYQVTYDAADSSGNDAVTAIRTVNVIEPDTTPPVITMAGLNPQVVEGGDPYVELGATAVDAVEGSVPVTIDAGDVDTSQLGVYQVTYDASDSSGNDAVTQTRTVQVVDTTPPVISMLGVNPQVVEGGDPYVELWATAVDAVEGPVPVTIDAGDVDTSQVGSYQVRYDASDSSGNDAATTRTVQVQDTTAPTITILGSDPAVVLVGTGYTDGGATAVDVVDGSVPVVADLSDVDTSQLGVYQVTYDASDSSGNDAPTATRMVQVIDTNAPIITLLGPNPQFIELGDPYVELGAVAVDDIDGSVSVVVDAGGVDTSQIGTYPVTYDAVDSSGNPAVTMTRTVEVIDVTPPVINLLGGTPQVLEVGEPYVELGAAAIDDVDGLVAVLIDASEVDTSTVGSYQVIYDAVDSSGNWAVTQVRSIQIVEILGGGIDLDRWAGSNRYETSAVVSAESFSPGVDVVYVTVGTKFADALSVGPVAGGVEVGPVLLTDTNVIPGVIQAELVRLAPAKIVVVGGPSVVSDVVFKQLADYL